ncbi:DUF6731 family protein [Microvirga roseola]|uniref:DUF6731 family protein n=1 Tax=Microvirga roseola TaxID=2883126 RepID=UPI001E53FA4E|nr:DUF6731 family protein [Microvirga roseola]
MLKSQIVALEGYMKIHAYRVIPRGEISLETVLSHLHGLPLEQRIRSTPVGSLRLEDSDNTGPFWLLDFGGISPHGPGRASASTPIEDFDLLEEEGFGQETAALYDPASGFMTLQYNHFGPRAGRIQAYLYKFARVVAGQAEGEELPDAPDGFTLLPVMKAETTSRLNHLGIVKRIEMSFYVPGVIENQGRQRPSLSSILDNPVVGSAEQIKLQIVAGRGRAATLAVAPVRQLVTDLLGVREDVVELSITARETEEAPSEPMDFIEARLQADIPIQRTGRRYGRRERWTALRQAFEAWRDNGQFT